MDTLLSQIFTIFNQESDASSKESKLYGLVRRVFSEVMIEAFEMVDQAVIQSYHEEGYRIEKRSKCQDTFVFGTVSFTRYRLTSSCHLSVFYDT